MIGAGTVINMNDLKLALDAGASFIVSPVLIDDVMAYCVKNSILVFPGAFTPTEIYRAWQAGATMVKVFPAKFFGPQYIKEVKAPLQDIELMACGGISVDTVADFFSCKASAVAFGSNVLKKELIESGDFGTLIENLSQLVRLTRESILLKN